VRLYSPRGYSALSTFVIKDLLVSRESIILLRLLRWQERPSKAFTSTVVTDSELIYVCRARLGSKAQAWARLDQAQAYREG
jgi:hypothetical protein